MQLTCRAHGARRDQEIGWCPGDGNFVNWPVLRAHKHVGLPKLIQLLSRLPDIRTDKDFDVNLRFHSQGPRPRRGPGTLPYQDPARSYPVDESKKVNTKTCFFSLYARRIVPGRVIWGCACHIDYNDEASKMCVKVCPSQWKGSGTSSLQGPCMCDRARCRRIGGGLA